ncbi:MAG: M48 family metallopeptidase [Piscirickettsiaceae bacterium]|nr:M48 family metallopeptidase [Piscirickettsiaceae bacterium]
MQTIQGDGFTVTVIKSRRRTTAIKIKDGAVSIHIPNRLAITFAQEFILQKTAWIQQKLRHQAHAKTQRASIKKQFIAGENFLFLGKHYSLRLIEKNSKVSIIKRSQTLDLYGRQNRLSKTGIHAALVAWYKQQAEQYLTSRTLYIANQINLSPRSISIKTYKARWGSCSQHTDINFNWKLVLAPARIIDYVIIHELCHIQYFNHSSQFWSLVEQFCPSFKQERHWLKENSYTLEF